MGPVTRGSKRWLLAGLCLFAGLTSLWGGAELVWRPDGSGIGLPPSLLQHSPFRDFLVPGFLLAGVVGVANTVAGALAARERALANRVAMVAGAALTIWIVVEVVLLRSVHWLHAVYLLLGLAIVAVAVAREKDAGALDYTLRSFARLLAHAVAGWMACGAIMATLLATTTLATALLVHAVAAPLVFAAVSVSYFRRPTAWAPLPAALALAGLAALLDLLIVVNFVERSLAMFQSIVGTWLPLAFMFLSAWMTGSWIVRRHPDHHSLASV